MISNIQMIALISNAIPMRLTLAAGLTGGEVVLIFHAGTNLLAIITPIQKHPYKVDSTCPFAQSFLHGFHVQ